jgi:LysR family transcriptional regulator, glycine cleavage system transcriptional activator
LVKLGVTAAFAKLWLPKRQRCALRIELDVSPMYADIAGGQVDMAIRYGQGICNELEVKPFLPEKLYPVAHPALASQLTKESRRLGDAALLDVPLLHDSDVAGWHEWFNARGIQFKPRAQDRRFEDYNLVLGAAEGGLGVALARAPFADAYLGRSQLVRVGRHEIDSARSFYFVHAKGESRPEVLALIERMRRAVVEEQLKHAAGKTTFIDMDC